MSSAGGATIVLGVIGSDVHAVGNKILEKVFSDAGFKVINLGVMVSHEEFISAAIETGAEAILVSSLYGQGELDCQGLREECIERGIEDIILYVGGNLVIGKTESVTIRDKFKAMGYDRVFVPSDELDEAVTLLHGDIEEQRSRAGQ